MCKAVCDRLCWVRRICGKTCDRVEGGWGISVAAPICEGMGEEDEGKEVGGKACSEAGGGACLSVIRTQEISGPEKG
jgi:hypothetical protein